MGLTPPAISLKNISVRYEKDYIFKNVTGAFKPGSLTAIVGPNGGGKSTLLKAIMDFLRPAAGSILRPDISQISYLPQRNTVDRSFPITVLDAASMGLWNQVGTFHRVGLPLRRKIQEALKAVKLHKYRDHMLDCLSGGQFQRVLFSRLILQDTPIILLDEPFTCIDNCTAHDLSELILEWNAQGKTIIAVLHDFDLVRKYFPETLILSREVVAWGKTSKVLTKTNIEKMHQLSLGWED